MTPTLLAGFALAAVCGVSAAAFYLALPRRLTAEEWILHRRALASGPVPPVIRLPVLAWRGRWISPVSNRAVADSAERDLQLLRVAGEPAPASIELLWQTMTMAAGVGAAVGAIGGL